MLQPRLDVEHLEYLLLLLELERQVRRHRIGQASRFVDAGERGQDFRRNLLVQLDVLVERRKQRAAQRLDSGAGAPSTTTGRLRRPSACARPPHRDVCARAALDQTLSPCRSGA